MMCLPLLKEPLQEINHNSPTQIQQQQKEQEQLKKKQIKKDADNYKEILRQ